MSRIPETGVTVYRVPSRARCREMWAVLDAAAIPATIEERRGDCRLVVREEDLLRARRELDDYRNELTQRQPEPPLIALPGGWLGMLGYAIALVAVSGLVQRHAFDADWFEAGRAQAGLMRQGEWWRAVTALTLHVDGRHLMGNLFFGSVLGFLASQALGGGVAWLAILAGGALGNAANAFLHVPEHSAVGASTAVFAALGLLVALALRHRRAHADRASRRWSPLVAGLLLLAWTGMGGERTDVLAHVTGLLSGIVVGACCGLLPFRLLEKLSLQAIASLLALALLVAAWRVALPSIGL